MLQAPAPPRDRGTLLTAVAASALFHGLLLWSNGVSSFLSMKKNVVELDLTMGVRLGVPRGSYDPAVRETPKPKPTGGVAPKTEWTLPAPDQSAAIPVPSTEPTPAPLEGDAPSTESAASALTPEGGEYDMGHAGLTRLPQILNLAQLERNLQFFYPEAERRARREGHVTVIIHVSAQGRVTDVEVAQSAGPAFDAAARRVVLALKFKPALMGHEPVAVRLRQTIHFTLQDGIPLR